MTKAMTTYFNSFLFMKIRNLYRHYKIKLVLRKRKDSRSYREYF